MTEIIKNYLDYLGVKGLSPATIRVYYSDLNQLTSFLKSQCDLVLISSITYTYLRYFLSYLSEIKLNRRTIARKISSIREFFKYCINMDIIDKNPAEKLITPKFISKLPKVFTIKEMHDLISLPDTSTIFGKRDRAILEVMYSTGCRISELSNMKLIDIDFDSCFIKVNGKGNKDRYVPIGKMAVIALRNYLRDRDSIFPSTRQEDKDQIDYIFISKNGKQISPNILRFIINGYISQIAKSEGYTPHSIRHSFATHMLECGASLMSVKQILGHESVCTTEIYTRLSIAYQRRACNQYHPVNNSARDQLEAKFFNSAQQ